MKLISYLSIFTGCGIALFWVLFFTLGLAPENPPACYFVYEHAFPLPDAVLAIGLIGGGLMVLKNESRAVWLLPPAGGLIFLGLVDFAFNFQNGLYLISLMDGIFNAVINGWCVIFGGVIIAFVKKRILPSQNT
ncbi:MAG: hypothetical protein N2316_12660 [Spirochaetes bacterium]|nr:hypothetical protein [Spirochaetota bacterium]